jgi:teichoic acid transport system permease protein
MSTGIEPSTGVVAPSGDGRARHHRGREDEFTSKRHVYEPHFVGLPPLRSYLREVWRRREFAYELSRTQLRAQHFDTAFGQLWLVLNPLLLAGVYFILVDIIRHGKHGPGFLAHLIAGIFAYYYVSGAIREGVKSVTSGGKLILNSAFPRVLLPLSSVVTAWKRFIPTVIIYIPIHLVSGLPVNATLLWAIPLIGLMTVLAAGFCMVVAAVQVYFRDLASFLPYGLRLWLYISPVLYFAHEVPGSYRPLLSLNPIGELLAAWSDVLNRGLAPSPGSLAIASAWAFGVLIIGFLFFVSREREFAVRL